MLEDMIKQKKRTWRYSPKNSIYNVLCFEHILNYTVPFEDKVDKDWWGCRIYLMVMAGGSLRKF